MTFAFKFSVVALERVSHVQSECTFNVFRRFRYRYTCSVPAEVQFLQQLTCETGNDRIMYVTAFQLASIKVFQHQVLS